MSRETSRDTFDKKREITHKQRMKAFGDFEPSEKVDLHDAEVSSEQKRVVTFKQRMNSLKEFKAAEKSPEQKKETTHKQSAESDFFNVSVGAQKREVTYKQRPNFWKKLMGLEDSDLHCPKISPYDQKRVATHEQRLRSFKECEGVEFADFRQLLEIKKSQNNNNVAQNIDHTSTSANSSPKTEKSAEKPIQIKETSTHDTIKKENVIKNPIKIINETPRSFKEFEGVEYADLRQLLELKRSQNNNVAHKIDHTSANFSPKSGWFQNQTGKSSEKPVQIKETSTHDTIRKQNIIKYPIKILNKTPRSFKEFEGIEYADLHRVLEIEKSQNNNVAYKIDHTSANFSPKSGLLQNETGKSAEKPVQIKETSTHDTIKENVIKHPIKIINKTPIKTVNALFPLKQSLNHRMAAIRQRNLEIEKATKFTETSPENAKKEFVAKEPAKIPNQFGIIKNSLAAFRQENSKTRIARKDPVKITNTVSEATLSQDTKKEIVLKQHTSLKKFNGLEDFDLVEHTISKPKETIENEAGPDSVTLPLYKAPHFLGSPTDFSNERLNSPNSACKDEFFELLRNMNCAITRGELARAKSSRMPRYVLETWIKDNASARIQLCQMAVTLRRMMAAISLAEKECANRHNLVNMLETAVKENQTLKVVMSTTIDTEMFSEYFDGAPISSTRLYYINKFYLDEASEVYPKTLAMCALDNDLAVIHEEVVVILQYIHEMRELDGAILVFLPDWEDLVKVQNLLYPSDNVAVHLVYSQSLNDSELNEIHSKPPPGKRKIILATDIPESFISIDDLVYVVDTGMRKYDIFDSEKGINGTDLEWISKAHANQRAGLTGFLGQSYHFSFYTEERYRMFVD